ncbi:hypothetical protein HAX54_010632 [Datura stramonium]|uniref:Anaphase-promoting complex subunit 5 n=1 Tax=Datura stramonium TaxID=4076 RepID=A0ABS8RWZ0_DATST|nr:hypothetical protein [Datura stramonium]
MKSYLRAFVALEFRSLVQSGTPDVSEKYFYQSAGTEGCDFVSSSSTGCNSFGRYEIALLCLGMMHFHFGHPKQALEVLTEAVRVSQQQNNDSCLAYTLAAICKLLSEFGVSNMRGLIGSSYSPVTSIGTSLSTQQLLYVLLRRSLKRAEILKLKRLVASNHLAMAKFDLTKNSCTAARFIFQFADEFQASEVLQRGRWWMSDNFLKLERWEEHSGCDYPRFTSDTVVVNLCQSKNFGKEGGLSTCVNGGTEEEGASFIVWLHPEFRPVMLAPGDGELMESRRREKRGGGSRGRENGRERVNWFTKNKGLDHRNLDLNRKNSLSHFITACDKFSAKFSDIPMDDCCDARKGLGIDNLEKVVVAASNVSGEQNLSSNEPVPGRVDVGAVSGNSINPTTPLALENCSQKAGMLVCIPARLEHVGEVGIDRGGSYKSNFFHGGTSASSLELGRNSSMAVYHYGKGALRKEEDDALPIASIEGEKHVQLGEGKVPKFWKISGRFL